MLINSTKIKTNFGVLEISNIFKGMKVETDQGYKTVIFKTKVFKKNKVFYAMKIRGEYLKFSDQKFIINGEPMYGKNAKIGDRIKAGDNDVLIEDTYTFPYYGMAYSIKVDNIGSGFFLLDDIMTYM